MRKNALLSLILIGFFGFQSAALVCSSSRNKPTPKALHIPGSQANSLSGVPFPAPTIPAEEKTKLEENLRKAKSELAKNPESVDAIIWVGRRTAYLGLYREAIEIYTEGIQKFPDSAKLYRHRGHRYLTVREIDQAIADFKKATQLIQNVPDEIEPDGIPNAKNIPTSTLNFNIWYHLGLAYYIKGDFSNALRSYQDCIKFSNNDDMKVATSYWMYLTLMQLKKTEEASKILQPISKEMEVIEDFEYRDLLLMYKGEIKPEPLLDPSSKDDLKNVTLGYGMRMHYLFGGNSAQAQNIFCEIVKGNQWAAFGYLATEAELLRLGFQLVPSD